MLPLGLIEKLPQNIATLNLPWETFPASENIETFFKAMPRKLTEFSTLSPKPVPFTPHPTSSTSSLLLPRHLLNLHLPCLDFGKGSTATWAQGLPVTLCYLFLELNQLQMDVVSAFGTLMYLLSLNLTIVHPPSGGKWAQYLNVRALPRQLTEFKLCPATDDDSGASDITNDTLIGSPSSLTEIHLPESPLLDEACLVHLPAIENFWVGVACNSPDWFDEMEPSL
jgi:hypothetical protein